MTDITETKKNAPTLAQGLTSLEVLDTRAACDKPYRFQPTHPLTGDPLAGMFIDVLGRDSTAFREFTAERNDRRVQKATRGQVKTLTTEELEDQKIELLVVLTAGWEGVSLDGKTPLEFNVANAKALYKRFGWLAAQVDDVAGDLSNFLKG